MADFPNICPVASRRDPWLPRQQESRELGDPRERLRCLPKNTFPTAPRPMHPVRLDPRKPRLRITYLRDEATQCPRAREVGQNFTRLHRGGSRLHEYATDRHDSLDDKFAGKGGSLQVG